MVDTRIDPRYSSTLSKLFSSALFRDLGNAGRTERLRYINSVRSKAFSPGISTTLREFFKTTYLHLRRSYPSEYVYKNEAIKQVVLRHHKLSETGLFTEFPCHGSKADLLAVNGTTTVYEIKTELDTLTRLKQQLHDYSKAFARVNVITCPGNVDQVIKILSGTPFGLLVYDPRVNRFDTIKEAHEDLDMLDAARMFSVLRMGEYKEMIGAEFGFVPDVINTKIYDACLTLFRKLDKEKQRDWVTSMLHKRQITREQMSFSGRLPTSLKTLGVTRPLTNVQCATIEDTLDTVL